MRCVLVDPYATRNADRLAASLTTPWDIQTVARQDSESMLKDTLSTAEAAISQVWNQNLGRNAAKLRLLQLPNAGTDGVDWGAVSEGCTVCNEFEHETAVAEFVLLAMLEFRIGLRGLDQNFRGGDWGDSHVSFGRLHGEMAGATVGLIGYGRIAQAIARRAAAFDVTVAAVSRRKPDDPILNWSGSMMALDSMLPRCDFVVIACPLTAETCGLIDERQLALMQDSAVLINIARAGIADEAALFSALSDRKIAGAALDVWWRYPDDSDASPRPSRFPFWKLPNVLMTPHVAGWTDGMLARRWKKIAANLDRFATGAPLENVVRRPKSGEPPV
jgi:phosphoglycerate dehydrogenase-like enzyme